MLKRIQEILSTPWKRTLFVILFAQMITAVGFSIFFPFLPLYVESLGDTLQLPKHYQGVFYNLGNTMFHQENYKDAIGLYQSSYSEDSTLTGQMLYNRANALLKSGDPGAAIESYVQALQFLPDDEDVRHNLELALLQAQQQQEEQQQQQGEQNEDQEGQDEQQQQRQEQQEQQERKDEEQQNRDEQEQEEQQQQPDSTQAPQPQPDSTQVPQPQLSEEDLQKMSKEDAMRILQALEEQEKKLQEERRKAAFRRQKKSGKDW